MQDSGGGTSFREGWSWLLLVTSARGYLALIAALGAIALMPALFGWGSSVVQSSSMEPGVSAGDVVLASGLPDDRPVPVGAAVTFERDGRLILHRIVRANDDGTFVTAGDGNEQLDSEPVTRSDITGIARLLVPAVGLPSLWLDHREFSPFAVWIVLTSLALTTVVIGFPAAAPVDPIDGRRPRGQHSHPPRTSPVRVAATATVAVVLVAAIGFAPHGVAHAAFTARTETVHSVWSAKVFTPLSMGRAAGFAALAAVGVTNSSTFNTSITGSVGTTPGKTFSGFWPWDISGDTALDTAAARAAMMDAAVVPMAAAERVTTRRLAPALSGTILPGVYESTTGAFSLPGTLVLDAKGDPSARFIFRTTGALTLAQKSRIALAGGATAGNVWWIVGGSLTAGANSLSRDTIAAGNFVVTGSAQLRGIDIAGRVVSRTGSVAMHATQIVVPSQ